MNSPNIDLGDGPDSANVNIDLSSTPLTIGDTVTITNVRADGDLDGAPEVFALNFNSGQEIHTGLQTGQQFTGLASVGLADFELTVIDIGGGTPGINVVATSPADVDQFGGNPYGARINFDISFESTPSSSGTPGAVNSTAEAMSGQRLLILVNRSRFLHQDRRFRFSLKPMTMTASRN